MTLPTRWQPNALDVALTVLGRGPNMALAGFLLALPLLIAGVLYLACCGWTMVTAMGDEGTVQEQVSKRTLAIA